MVKSIDNSEADRFARLVFERIGADPEMAKSGTFRFETHGDTATIRWDGLATMPADEFFALFNAAEIKGRDANTCPICGVEVTGRRTETATFPLRPQHGQDVTGMGMTKVLFEPCGHIDLMDVFP